MTNQDDKAFDIVKNNDLYKSVISNVKDPKQREIIEQQVKSYALFLQELISEIQKKSDENK